MEVDLYVMVAVFFAYVIKGLCGFANTLVFSTVMGFRENNISISPIELLLGYPSNVIIAVRERAELSARVWLPLSALVLLGTIPGVFLLKDGDTGYIKIFFGLVVIFVGLEMLLRDKRIQDTASQRQTHSSRILLGIIGLLSGLLCGLFGIGALLSAYISRTTDNNSAFRGNLCLVFIIENTFRIILYSATGILTTIIWKQSALLLPVMLLGLLTGMLLSHRISEHLVRKTVIIMLILSGLTLTLNNTFFAR